MEKVNSQMTDTQSRGSKIVYLLLGVALPVLAITVLTRGKWGFKPVRKEQIDQAHDLTVEDSFPASDPPSAW
jgi:hypothetical protein